MPTVHLLRKQYGWNKVRNLHPRKRFDPSNSRNDAAAGWVLPDGPVAAGRSFSARPSDRSIVPPTSNPPP